MPIPPNGETLSLNPPPPPNFSLPGLSLPLACFLCRTPLENHREEVICNANPWTGETLSPSTSPSLPLPHLCKTSQEKLNTLLF
jgi:hypothetical protein